MSLTVPLLLFQCVSMRYVAAYLLAAQSGKTPSKDDIKKILGSVGIECDDSRADQVVSQMSGKKVDDVIAGGKSHRLDGLCGWWLIIAAVW